MKVQRFVVLATWLACSGSVLAQDRQAEKGLWRAASTTARGVTGDIGFAETRITLNFTPFTVAQIRPLASDEAQALFKPESASAGSGNLYRTAIPADRRFLHRNTLCGSEAVQWVITWVEDKTLSLAFFSGSTLPKLSAEAVANTTSLCGTFSYVR